MQMFIYQFHSQFKLLKHYIRCFIVLLQFAVVGVIVILHPLLDLWVALPAGGGGETLFTQLFVASWCVGKEVLGVICARVQLQVRRGKEPSLFLRSLPPAWSGNEARVIWE